MPDAATQAEIIAICRCLFPADAVTELAALGCVTRTSQRAFRNNRAGWFNDWNALALAAMQVDYHAEPEGLYIIPNALHPGCLG